MQQPRNVDDGWRAEIVRTIRQADGVSIDGVSTFFSLATARAIADSIERGDHLPAPLWWNRGGADVMPAPKKLRIPDDVQTFGQALRWAREERKMTMRQACNAIGITPPFWCDLEHDRRETSRVAEIARVLGVELEDLERRQGMSADLKDWLSKNPKIMRLIRDIRARRCEPLILKAIKDRE